MRIVQEPAPPAAVNAVSAASATETTPKPAARSRGKASPIASRAKRAVKSPVAGHAALLELALDGSEVAIGSWTLPDFRIEWEHRLKHLYGFSADESLTVEKLIERIHPDDRERIASEMHDAIESKSGACWIGEFRILHPVRGLRWIQRRARFEFDSAGNPVRTLGVCIDITRRKRDEEAMLASELKYRRLHDSMFEAFASVGLDGRFLESNAAFQQMLGYSGDELLEKHFLDVTPERWHEMESELALNPEFFERGYSEPYEKEYLRKDGSVVPVELRAFLIRDSNGDPERIWGIARDITHRKVAEQKLLEWNKALEFHIAERTASLRQSEERFRLLASATFEGIAVCENGTIIDCNPQLASLFGVHANDLIGQPIVGVFDSDCRPEILGLFTGEVGGTFECSCGLPGSQGFPAEVRAETRTLDDRTIFVVAIRDLTASKEAEKRLFDLQMELCHSQRLGLFSEVSAGIIHQIAQPMCSMEINLAAAMRQVRAAMGESSEAMRALADVESEITRLRETVVHLKSLAKPGPSAFRAMNLNELLADLSLVVAGETKRRQTRLELDLADPLPPVHADSVQFSQVILNLIHNSLDALDQSPPENRHIKVSTGTAGHDHVKITVEDQGPGIAAGILDDPFAAFATTKPGGLGIGLRLCSTIIEAHGGTITGKNRSDQPGAIFEILLPRANGDYTEV
jgi:PAS domain S-box-containing protein